MRKDSMCLKQIPTNLKGILENQPARPQPDEAALKGPLARNSLPLEQQH
jgi:hypothetical protein